MPFENFRKKMEDFEYEAACRELGIDPKDPSRWVKFQVRARTMPGLALAQMVHDLSWVMTQVQEPTRRQIDVVADKVRQALTLSLGPYALPALREFDVTVESFVLPLARNDGTSDLSVFVHMMGGQTNLPSEGFAETFAVNFVKSQMANAFREMKVSSQQCGRRVLVGWVKGCTSCGGNGVIKSVADRIVEQGRAQAQERARHGGHPVGCEVDDDQVESIGRFLEGAADCNNCQGTGIDRERLIGLIRGILEHGEGNPEQRRIAEKLIRNQPVTNGEIMHAFGAEVLCRDCNGSGFDAGKCRAAADAPWPVGGRTLASVLLGLLGNMSTADTSEIFGTQAICPECSCWVDVPTGARSGWIGLVTDGHENKREFARLTITD